MLKHYVILTSWTLVRICSKKFHVENHTSSGTDAIETAEYCEAEEFGPQYEEITELTPKS